MISELERKLFWLEADTEIINQKIADCYKICIEINIILGEIKNERIM